MTEINGYRLVALTTSPQETWVKLQKGGDYFIFIDKDEPGLGGNDEKIRPVRKVVYGREKSSLQRYCLFCDHPVDRIEETPERSNVSGSDLDRFGDELDQILLKARLERSSLETNLPAVRSGFCEHTEDIYWCSTSVTFNPPVTLRTETGPESLYRGALCLCRQQALDPTYIGEELATALNHANVAEVTAGREILGNWRSCQGPKGKGLSVDPSRCQNPVGFFSWQTFFGGQTKGRLERKSSCDPHGDFTFPAVSQLIQCGPKDEVSFDATYSLGETLNVTHLDLASKIPIP